MHQSRCFTIAVSEEGFLIHHAIGKPDLQIVVAVSLKRVWKSSIPHKSPPFCTSSALRTDKKRINFMISRPNFGLYAGIIQIR